MSYPLKCVPKETKTIYVKAFDMITNKNEAKAMTKHISCDCKCKFNSKTCNTKQKWSDKTCKCECKNYKCGKDYNWNPSTCVCENNKYLKTIADTSVTECYEIIIVIDNVPTKKTNTITTKMTNTTNTTSINCNSKKVQDCYILQTVLLTIMLL